MKTNTAFPSAVGGDKCTIFSKCETVVITNPINDIMWTEADVQFRIQSLLSFASFFVFCTLTKK